MARTKRRKQAKPIADAAPADFAIRPGDYREFTATDAQGRLTRAYQRQDRVAVLLQRNVIDARHAAALEGYREAHQAARRGNLRSCLNRTPPGDGPTIFAVIAAGKRLDALDHAVPSTLHRTLDAIVIRNMRIEDIAAERQPHSQGALYVMGKRLRSSERQQDAVKAEIRTAAECLAVVLRIGSEAT